MRIAIPDTRIDTRIAIDTRIDTRRAIPTTLCYHAASRPHPRGA